VKTLRGKGQRQFALEDIAFAQSPLAFEIEWRDDLAVEDDVLMLGAFGQRVDDGVAELFFFCIPMQAGGQFGRVRIERSKTLRACPEEPETGRSGWE